MDLTPIINFFSGIAFELLIICSGTFVLSSIIKRIFGNEGLMEKINPVIPILIVPTALILSKLGDLPQTEDEMIRFFIVYGFTGICFGSVCGHYYKVFKEIVLKWGKN